MKKIKIILLAFLILTNTIVFTGCWNYREIDELSIVAGVAIDKGEEGQIKMTVEIVQISSGKESNTKSKILSIEGKTIFDAARNMIALSGERLYWPHAKVIIISKEIASEGLTKVIDWYTRDSETRDEVYILISKAESAHKILSESDSAGKIICFKLNDMINNQKSLSKAPMINIMDFQIQSRTKGSSVVIPTVDIKQNGDKFIPEIMGTAIIKNNKLIGFLNDEETRDLIFIRNEIKGGVLTEEVQKKNEPVTVSLEIFKSNTKLKPVIDNNNITMNLNINTTVAIDEIDKNVNFFKDEDRMKLEKYAEKSLKDRIDLLIEKMQKDYDADIFGFAEKLQEDKMQVWKAIGDNWDGTFKKIKVNVDTKIYIKNSALLSKTLKEGD